MTSPVISKRTEVSPSLEVRRMRKTESQAFGPEAIPVQYLCQGVVISSKVGVGGKCGELSLDSIRLK